MKCPVCKEKGKENEMEKAAQSDTMICRQCGHSESGLTKAEMAAKIEDQEKRLQALEGKKKGKDEDEERW